MSLPFHRGKRNMAKDESFDGVVSSDVQPTLGGDISATWEVVGVGPVVDFTDRETGERIQGRKVHFVGPSLIGGLGRSVQDTFVRAVGIRNEPALGPAQVALVIGGAGKVKVAAVLFGGV